MKDASQEYELKIELTEPELAALRKRPALRALTEGRATTRMLRSIYFDTPDHALSRKGAALRLRKVGDRWIQTVKIGGGVVAGLSRPLESESDVAGPELDFGAIDHVKARAAVCAAAEKAGFEPVFETRIRRTARQLRTPSGETAELALDTGEIRAGAASRPIVEAELELLSNDPGAIYALAEEIFDGAPIRFSRFNKAARGFMLARGEDEPARTPERAGAGLISADQSVGEAFEAIARDCLRMIAANASLVMDDDAPEGPHQLRVGLRRLRSATQAFAPVLKRKPMKALQRGARDWARIVGRLRDADVLAEEIVEPAATALGDRCDPLLAALSEHRIATRSSVRDAMIAQRFGAFSLDLAATIETGRWRPGGKKQSAKKRKALTKPIAPFAAEALSEAWDEVAAWGARIDELTTPERHEMRKALKTFRYTVDFFAPAFDPESAKAFARVLRKLQNGFGYLNDLATAEDLPALFADHPDADRLQEAAQAVVDWHAARAHKTWDKAVARWRELSAEPRFWA